jgi:hypothetical protein
MLPYSLLATPKGPVSSIETCVPYVDALERPGVMALQRGNNNNSIKFVFLRENLTAQRPVTKLAQVRRMKQQNTN